ncbi:site-2 protease family protein [Halorussus caseinilyticus]|uniref:Site-2 protease family protein n=1 Tax=Halorussus caseinilyticus TaxID=3034025 RepID=A0ABD5WSU3_9EURY|nr:site-2 protease family protein [Halorussus sp. DT72]
MGSTDPPADGPSLERLSAVFRVYEARRDGDRLVYYGEPLVPRERLLDAAWPVFREHGYEVQLTTETGEYVLVAEPADTGIDGIPWTNVVLFFLTVVSTLYAGTAWYHIDAMESPLAALEAWPFTAAVLGVLLTHELGHYVMTRYHGVDASLPYFIPMPSLIGTMGAVIRMKGQMPDRKALFDIGVAGPLAGLVATIAVTAIGLSLPPEQVPASLMNNPDTIQIEFGYPPLLELIAWVLGEPTNYGPGQAVNPVVIGGWVGMFITFLNLIPVGQLDGGHIVRAILGKEQERVAALVPVALFGLAAYVFYVEDVSNASVLWVFWGLLATYVAYVGPANPIDDEGLDLSRKAIGILTFVLGVLCFTPVPIEIIT